jgi:hypothetical protein
MGQMQIRTTCSYLPRPPCRALGLAGKELAVVPWTGESVTRSNFENSQFWSAQPIRAGGIGWCRSEKSSTCTLSDGDSVDAMVRESLTG